MAMKPPMLKFDLKRTNPVAFSAVRKYLKETLGYDEDEFANTMENLESLRNSCTAGEPSESSIAFQKKYYAILYSLQKRFPISENHVRVCFSWNDSFPGTKSKIISFVKDKESSYNIEFEKAAILFNIAASFSNLGALVDRHTSDGIKLACTHFQHAAGLYEEVRKLMERFPQLVLTLDMDPCYLNTLAMAMIAQAQECFYEKAIADGMKDTALSKLASQVSEYYGRAFETIQNPKLYNYPHAVTMGAHLEMRRKLFYAGAHYRYSNHLKSQIKYGAQVAHLQLAHAVLVDPKNKQLEKLLAPEFQERLQASEKHIGMVLGQATKDNEKIYYQPIPKDAPRELPKHAIVKAKLPADLGVLVDDPFAKVVPFAVQEAVISYNDKKAKRCRCILNLVEEHNNIVKGSLSSMGLPGALMAHGSSAMWPEDILKKVATLKDCGGVNYLLDSFGEVQTKSAKCTQLCEHAIRILDEEEQDDIQQRSRYGASWKRTPSHMLTEKLREEGAKYRGNLEHSTKSDSYVRSKFADQEKIIRILSQSQEAMNQLLPPEPRSESAAVSAPIVEKLGNLLHQLDDTIAMRLKLNSDLKQKMETEDLSDEFLSVEDGNYDKVMDEALAKYETFRQQIEKNISEQERLLVQITSANEEFTSYLESKNLARSDGRSQIYQKVNVALMVYLELVGNLGEGKQFYKDFGTLVENFQRKCQDFKVARDLEKETVIEAIREQQKQQQLQQQQYQQQLQQQQQIQQQRQLGQPPSSGRGGGGYPPQYPPAAVGGAPPSYQQIYQQMGQPPSHPSAPSAPPSYMGVPPGSNYR